MNTGAIRESSGWGDCTIPFYSYGTESRSKSRIINASLSWMKSAASVTRRPVSGVLENVFLVRLLVLVVVHSVQEEQIRVYHGSLYLPMLRVAHLILWRIRSANFSAILFAQPRTLFQAHSCAHHNGRTVGDRDLLSDSHAPLLGMTQRTGPLIETYPRLS